jgi:hypothetical protein
MFATIPVNSTFAMLTGLVFPRIPKNMLTRDLVPQKKGRLLERLLRFACRVEKAEKHTSTILSSHSSYRRAWDASLPGGGAYEERLNENFHAGDDRSKLCNVCCIQSHVICCSCEIAQVPVTVGYVVPTCCYLWSCEDCQRKADRDRRNGNCKCDRGRADITHQAGDYHRRNSDRRRCCAHGGSAGHNDVVVQLHIKSLPGQRLRIAERCQ